MAPLPFSPLHPTDPEAGYGQLSISTPGGVEAVSGKHAAGLFAVVGAQSEVSTLVAAGPQVTAAVVAQGDAQAIWATSTLGPAVTATSQSAQGVQGISTSGVGVYGTSSSQVGVVGESTASNGVYGISHSAAAAAVAGRNLAADPSKLAGFFDGNVQVTGDIFLQNADCAEDFTICADDSAEPDSLEPDSVEPGSVMVLAEQGAVRPCTRAYDKRVAGVVSGAGNYRPAIVLDRQSPGARRQPIALLGKVYCKVDASYGAIEVGDLLTTSQTRGYAMKAAEPAHAFGAILGKALQPWSDGRGLIPVLVALQ